MNHSLLTHATSTALEKLLGYVQEKKVAALTGLPDSMTAFVAAKIASETGKRVLLISGNDLKATHDAEDAQQLLGAQAVCLPGGEIDLTRGASSHESAWRRLEALSRAAEGEVRLMCASVDAMMQRMGESDLFRRSIIRLAAGDEYPPDKLIHALTRMGYERVDMVEGKGQCAMRGAILDVYPPAGAHSLRIEFFDDEVDSIRTFDCISQRSLEHLDSCVLAPATEVLLAQEQCAGAAARMRRAIEKNQQAAAGETLLFEGLPPLPDDEELLAEMFDKKISPKLKEKERSAARAAELERRMAQLMNDADTVENGLPFRRIRAWLPVLCEKTATILDWYRPEIIVLSQPDHLRERTVERLNNFQEDLQGAMERGEAVQEQENLLLGWEEMLEGFAGRAVIASAEMLRGMGGLHPVDAIDLQVRGVAGYSSQVKLLAEDCEEWLREGWRVAILSGGVARGKRLAQALGELSSPATFAEELHNLIPGEALDITTWASPVRHMLSQRNYLLADAGGLSLGRAAGSWALVDRETRAMVDWTGRLDAFETEVTGLEPPRPAAPEKLEPQFSRVFTVPASWLDMNGHMNNTRYFDLAQTCIAPEADGLVLKTVRAAFLSEALAGDALTVSWARRDTLWSFSGVKNDAPCFRLSLEFA